MAGTSRYNLNGYSFASRPFAPDLGHVPSTRRSVQASGVHASGRLVDASAIQPRFPWVLLASYNSNGYRGVVADEDRGRFALSNRSIIPDEVILPLYNDAGARLSYSLEPQFPADTIDALQNIAWNWSSGELSAIVIGPDGSRVDLGTAAFVAKSGNGPTTKKTSFTAWKPHMYGRYTVTATGWIADASGRRYEGGGTYRFWIAKRMTLATATFQGMPYPVGSTYGRDTQFNPAVPADVTVTASLYPDSERRAREDDHVLRQGHGRGAVRRRAGHEVVPARRAGRVPRPVARDLHRRGGAPLGQHDAPRGRRLSGAVAGRSPAARSSQVGGKYVDRGETKFEGYVEARRHRATSTTSRSPTSPATCCSWPPKGRARTRSSRC